MRSVEKLKVIKVYRRIQLVSRPNLCSPFYQKLFANMSYKLTYFDTKGRGEAIRLIFAATGVKFADDRIPSTYWPKIKSGTPWGTLPVLELGNGEKTLGQSTTICRYLGRKFKLAGANDWESAKCDEYVDAINDLLPEFVKILFETDEAKKAELRQAFITTHSPKYLTRLNTLQLQNGGNFLVGEKMTWSDIYIADKLQAMEEHIDPAILNGYPHLRKLKDAVFANEKIKAYTERRTY